MKAPKIDLNFKTIHKEVFQEHQLNMMIRNSINRQREGLLESIHEYISDLRTFCFLDTWYPFLSMSNIIQFCQSPIFKRSQQSTKQILNDLEIPMDIKEKISNLLNNITKYTPLTIRCVNQYFSLNRPNLPFNPCDKMISLFAASTFPSLFGYCWCVEQGIAYIQALCDLVIFQIETCNGVNNPQFRNSAIVRETLKQFLHMSGVQGYLQKALSSNFSQLIYDKKFLDMNLNLAESQHSLLKLAKKWINDLENAITYMPTIIRFFFKQMNETVKLRMNISEIERQSLIEFLFFDLILQPAMLNPKLFSLIPETAVSPPTQNFTYLARVFRWNLNPTLVPKNQFPNLENDPLFHSIKTKSLLARLVSYKGNVEGIFCSKVEEISKQTCNNILVSLNDIEFLTTVINDTIDQVEYSDSNLKNSLKELCNFHVKIESSDLIDFWFESMPIPEIPMTILKNEENNEDLSLEIPFLEVKDNSTIKCNVKIEKSMIENVIDYLQNAKPEPNGPTSLSEFINSQKNMKGSHSKEWLSRTEAIQGKLNRINKSENAFLCHIQNEIVRRISENRNELSGSFKYQELCNVMKEMGTRNNKMIQQLTPIIYQAVLRLFFHKNKEINIQIDIQKDSLLTKPKKFVEFFSEVQKQIIDYAEGLGIGNKHKLRLLRQFHSEICSHIPYSDYLNMNPQYVKDDEMIVNCIDAIKEQFKSEKYTKTLTNLFNNPSTFNSAITILRHGLNGGAPLELLEQISNCIQIIQDIYLFEAGEACAGDDLVPLFVYVLIESNISHMQSICNYIDHYLMNLNNYVKVLDSKECYILTTFMAGISHLYQQSKTFTQIDNQERKIP